MELRCRNRPINNMETTYVCEHASTSKGKHFMQSHRLHKNVTVETECAFRTPKAALRAAPPEAKRARSARFAPPPRLKLPRFARPVKQKQGTNDLKPQCSDLRNILLTGFVGAKLGRTFLEVLAINQDEGSSIEDEQSSLKDQGCSRTQGCGLQDG